MEKEGRHVAYIIITLLVVVYGFVALQFNVPTSSPTGLQAYSPEATALGAGDCRANLTIAGEYYYLVADVGVCPNNGLTINASNITLDCAGFSIIGNGNAFNGVLIGLDGLNRLEGITIANCTIENFAAGIAQSFFDTNYTILRNNTVINMTTGITISSPAGNITIHNNTALNSVNGMSLSINDSNVTNNIAYNNSQGGIVVSGSNIIVAHNTVYNNSFAGGYVAGLEASLTLSTFYNNTAYNNSDDGFLLNVGGFTTYRNSTAFDNQGRGYLIQSNDDANNYYTDLTATHNNLGGFDFNEGGFWIIAKDSLFNNITTYHDQTSGVIFQSTANNVTLENSTFYNLSRNGINITGAVGVIIRNITVSNISQNGFWVTSDTSDDNQILYNFIRNTTGAGILIDETINVLIEGNNISNGSYGILMRGGADPVVTRNRIENISNVSMFFNTTERANITYNTIFNSTTYGMQMGVASNSSRIIGNNITYGNTGYYIYSQNLLEFSNNIAEDNFGASTGGILSVFTPTGGSCTQWAACTADSDCGGIGVGECDDPNGDNNGLCDCFADANFCGAGDANAEDTACSDAVLANQCEAGFGTFCPGAGPSCCNAGGPVSIFNIPQNFAPLAFAFAATNITNNTAYNNTGTGWQFIGFNNSNIINNTAHNSSGLAILIANVTNSFIENVSGTLNLYGLQLDNSSNNTLVNITQATTGGYALYLNGSSENNTFNNITITSNVTWIFINTSAGNNISNITFNASPGSVLFKNDTLAFSTNLNLSTLNLSIIQGNVFLDAQNLSFLNRTARLTFRNVNSGRMMVDFQDDGSFIDCDSPQCVNVSFSGGVFVVDVLSFTTYFFNETAAGVNLTLTKTDSPDPVTVGNTITYTISISVTGGTAFNVTLNDTLPAGVTFVATNGTADVGTNTTFSLGAISAGQTVTIEINVTADSAGAQVNTANVTFQNSSGNNFSAQVEETTTVVAAAAGGGSGGGSGSLGNAIICPAYCSDVRYQNVGICASPACKPAFETPAPVVQTPAAVPRSNGGAPLIVEEIEEEQLEPFVPDVVTTPSTHTESRKTSAFSWLIALLALIIAILIILLSRKRGSRHTDLDQLKEYHRQIK